MNPNILEELRTIALNNNSLHTAKIASAIVHRNKIISIGTNYMKSHPFQKLFSRNDDAIFWHAETHAIFNALKIHNVEFLSHCDIYIARVKRDHEGHILDGYAAPCAGCKKAIKKYNIRNVYYTQDDLIDLTFWNERLMPT